MDEFITPEMGDLSETPNDTEWLNTPDLRFSEPHTKCPCCHATVLQDISNGDGEPTVNLENRTLDIFFECSECLVIWAVVYQLTTSHVTVPTVMVDNSKIFF